MRVLRAGRGQEARPQGADGNVEKENRMPGHYGKGMKKMGAKKKLTAKQKTLPAFLKKKIMKSKKKGK